MYVKYYWIYKKFHPSFEEWNLFYLCGKNLFDLCKVFIKQWNRPYPIKELFQRIVFVG